MNSFHYERKRILHSTVGVFWFLLSKPTAFQKGELSILYSKVFQHKRFLSIQGRILVVINGISQIYTLILQYIYLKASPVYSNTLDAVSWISGSVKLGTKGS